MARVPATTEIMAAKLEKETPQKGIIKQREKTKPLAITIPLFSPMNWTLCFRFNFLRSRA